MANSKHSVGAHTVVGDTIRHAGDEVGDKADQVINKSSEFATDLQKTALKYGNKIGHYIQENPIKVTLYAGLVGLIVGRFMRRK